MNDSFKLAMQLTMVDMLSAGAQVARRNILSMGEAGKQVARDFDLMTTHITRGLKAIAVANYGYQKLKPGVSAAAGLQEATLDVKMNLMESGQNAGELAKQLQVVRATADQIQKQMPFGSQEVMQIENVLLKAGLKMNDVTAKGGAAWAAAALATISKEAPQAMGEGLVKIATPFNIKGGQYAELAEFITKVDQASVTTVPELVEGMKYVAGSAANLKVDWKEILQAMGVVAQSGLGGSIGGTSLNDFLGRLNEHSRETRRVMKGLNVELVKRGASPMEFWDKGGNLKKFPALIATMRQAMKPLTTKEKSFVLEKIFGEQGGRAAFALIKEGAGSWEEIGENIGKASSMQDKLTTRLEGFSANVKTLGGTTKTALANLFDPMLHPLTEALKMTNDLVDAVGRLAAKHPTMTAVGNGVAVAGIAGIAGYGAYSLARGGAAGARVLRGLGGLKGLVSNFGKTSLGIAEGKAVEAAAGVNPVFVVNWPAEFGGATPAAAAAAVARNGLPWAAIAGGAVVGVAAAGIPFSMYASDKAREHGWSGRSDYTNREYEVMGIGGRKKRDINLTVQIDEQGRVSSRSDDMGTDIKTMKRGDFFAAVSH